MGLWWFHVCVSLSLSSCVSVQLEGSFLPSLSLPCLLNPYINNSKSPRMQGTTKERRRLDKLTVSSYLSTYLPTYMRISDMSDCSNGKNPTSLSSRRNQWFCPGDLLFSLSFHFISFRFFSTTSRLQRPPYIKKPKNPPQKQVYRYYWVACRHY